MDKLKRKRASVVVLFQNQLLGFHAQDPCNGKEYFFLPGGALEAGESLAQAAVRETREETGYSVTLLPLEPKYRKYDFEWNGQIYESENWFFAGRLNSEKAELVDDASYHKGMDWISVENVDQVFSYHSDILEVIKQILNEQKGSLLA